MCWVIKKRKTNLTGLYYLQTRMFAEIKNKLKEGKVNKKYDVIIDFYNLIQCGPISHHSKSKKWYFSPLLRNTKNTLGSVKLGTV